MTEYYVELINESESTWICGVYQQLPTSPGIKSVAWKQCGAARGGKAGVKWAVNYNVCLGNVVQVGGIGVYQGSQVLPANLGTAWEVIMDNGVQQLKANGQAAEKDQVEIVNNSGFMAHPGVGMDGSPSVYVETYGNARGQFVVQPKYQVALWNNFIEGRIIRGDQAVGPWEVAFADGSNKAILTVTQSGEVVETKIKYTSI